MVACLLITSGERGVNLDTSFIYLPNINVILIIHAFQKRLLTRFSRLCLTKLDWFWERSGLFIFFKWSLVFILDVIIYFNKINKFLFQFFIYKSPIKRIKIHIFVLFKRSIWWNFCFQNEIRKVLVCFLVFFRLSQSKCITNCIKKFSIS